MKNKLGVIVPYRNRSTHLDKFLKDTPGKLKEQEIDFEIIVVEQVMINRLIEESYLTLV